MTGLHLTLADHAGQRCTDFGAGQIDACLCDTGPCQCDFRVVFDVGVTRQRLIGFQGRLCRIAGGAGCLPGALGIADFFSGDTTAAGQCLAARQFGGRAFKLGFPGGQLRSEAVIGGEVTGDPAFGTSQFGFGLSQCQSCIGVVKAHQQIAGFDGAGIDRFDLGDDARHGRGDLCRFGGDVGIVGADMM